uniref:DUF8040 domain-containing protein n=1 Tax=Cucumis melo TaxID=3656 RepID=A0A9I9EEI6_CUCME
MDEHELASIVNACIASQCQLLLMLELLKNNTKRITHETRHRIRQLAYFRMIHSSDLVCRQSTRMDRRCFAILCHLLRTIAGLTSTKVVDVEEMVAKFLHILAYDVKNRVIQREFMGSGETISHYFNMVLLANCLGALDGTYIKVNVPVSDRARYRTRKGEWPQMYLARVTRKEISFTYLPVGKDQLQTHASYAITTWLMSGTQMHRVSWHHTEANTTTCKNGVVLKMHLQRRKSS